MPNIDDYLALDVKRAAEITCTDEAHWYKLVAAKEVPAIRTSKNRIVIRTERVREWLIQKELEQNPKLSESQEETSDSEA